MGLIKYFLYGSLLGIFLGVFYIGSIILNDLVFMDFSFLAVLMAGISCFSLMLVLIALFYFLKDIEGIKDKLLTASSFILGILITVIPAILLGFLVYPLIAW